MISDDSRFIEIPRKIERARKHITKLDALLDAFHKSHPYRLVHDKNAETGKIDFRVKFTREIPRDVPVVVGDAVHNLRSALDHFAYAAVPGATFKTEFPIWRPPRSPKVVDIENLVADKLRGASPALIEAVNTLQPHEGGNGEWVWALDRLDVIDKHRLLLTIRTGQSVNALIPHPGLKAALAQLGPGAVEAMRSLYLIGTDPVQDGDVVFSIAPEDVEDDDEFRLRLYVELDEPASLRHKPVAPTLTALADEVEGLLERLIPLA